ncbi:MAG: Protein GrpE [Parcubacteria group bacterium GW2011_GWF2_43_11]|nr:MAG: Protein GrpE [Parcubacteria group bacterium GW2011_GWF2_43_11]
MNEEIKKEKPAFAKATAGEEKLEESEKKVAEYLAGWQRSRADLLNYKKEEMERIGEFLKYASEEFVLKVLPILDNFEIIEKKMPDNLKNDENIKGLLMIKNQLRDFLKSQGAEEVKSVGQNFDPNLHEVVGETEAKDKEKGLIVEEVQKGYKINGRLLRPAKVKIIK